MSHVTTHVLDISQGRPAEGINVFFEDEDGQELARGMTDSDGRVGVLGPEHLEPGLYRLRFSTGAYLKAAGHVDCAFFPEVTIAFNIRGSEHYHVPLLLSPFGYSTYRGS